MSISVAWFKRDLRVNDHRPLIEALRSGRPCLPLYVFEPDFWRQPEMDASHFNFVSESLRDLEQQLSELGLNLVLRTGEICRVLHDIHTQYSINSVYSHEETGSDWTYQRDRALKKWLAKNGIVWHEFPSNGVIRRLKSRNGWAGRWRKTMADPAIVPQANPSLMAKHFRSDPWPTDRELGLAGCKKQNLQPGGSKRGSEVLGTFLHDRGREYRTKMSSPVTAVDACSRISPYLTWGCLSVREVWQASEAARREWSEAKREESYRLIAGDWLKSITSFQSRLSWHCHFIQKLEDEPEIEFQNICRVYDGLREDDFDEEKFDAWKSGKTGYPMVDACMRFLHQSSWLNFRMRAMLVSFASYQLWLHWRPTSVYLARHFLDFEPGIHFPQFQMQSGVTGINAIRIYSPTKQLIDHDPTGVFVKTYVPELEHVPASLLSRLDKLSLDDQQRFKCLLGKDYPLPIVNEKSSVQLAKDRIYAIRRSQEARRAASEVYVKHGSRKRNRQDQISMNPTFERADDGSNEFQSKKTKSKSKRMRTTDDRQMMFPGFEDQNQD